MVIYREFKELKSLAAPVHWAMGMFDGVHLGHAGVIAAAVKGAGRGEAGKRAARHHGGRC